MSLSEHCADPVCQATGSFLQPSHVGSGAQDEQTPDIFVAAPADPEKIGLAARTELPGNEPNRCRKIATASVLLCVAHLCGQCACGDRADSRDAHQALSDLVVSELTCKLPVNLTDLLFKVLEVLVEAFENRNQSWRQFMHSEHRRQTCDGSVAYRQTDAELEKKAMHLVDGSGPLAHHRFTYTM
jgi:hypothetical protein